MNLSEMLDIAWEGIARNKLRSLLTMLGVIIGVAAVIIMIAISAGTEATIADQIETLGTNLLFINPNNFGARVGGGGFAFSGGSSNGLTMEDVQAIRDTIQGVDGVMTERNTAQLVKAGSISIDGISLVGTTPDFTEVRGVSIGQGRFINQNDIDHSAKIAVLGYSLATDLFGESNPIGQRITVGNNKLTVVGVLAETGLVGNIDYDARLYAPITLVFDKFTPSQAARFIGNMVNSITVKVADKNQMDAVITQIELLLAKRHQTTLDALPFSILTQDTIIQTQAATTEAFRSLLAWVASVSLVVGGIGIMNIMLVSVTERTREIGIRQAIGATPNDVRFQFLTEALMLSLVGGLIGVIAGVGGSWLFNDLGQMRTVLVPNSIVLAFSSAAAVGIFFGFYPANKAARLDPIVALRHE